MLYSPINYQGNKSRIVDTLLQFIPRDTTSINEIFCGSAILSIASDIRQVYLNDTNHYILDLLEFFYQNEAENIIQRTDDVIRQYGLTNTFYEGRDRYIEHKHEGLSLYNREAFNNLKNDYNQDRDIVKLFTLIIYGFNHYLRFNSKDEFNIPVGKVDFAESIRKRTIDFCRAIKSKQIIFSNTDFRSTTLYEGFDSTALFYFDPPYLIADAPYNIFWSESDERDLLNLLDNLHIKGLRFLLSNVTETNGKTNNLLINWSKKYNLRHIKRQYLNSSYQKKNLSNADEVVIFNY